MKKKNINNKGFLNNNNNNQANVPTTKGESTEPGYMHYEFGKANDLEEKIKDKKLDK